VAHPGLRSIVSALKEAPEAVPEALMSRLGAPERGLLAAILVDDRPFTDVQGMIRELKKRYDIRRRKQRVHQVRLAIVEAQAVGDPSVPALAAELRSLQREAEAVRELAVTRPLEPGPHAAR
jgi:hypothetical protein